VKLPIEIKSKPYIPPEQIKRVDWGIIYDKWPFLREYHSREEMKPIAARIIKAKRKSTKKKLAWELVQNCGPLIVFFLNKYFKDLTTEELIDDAIHAAHCAFSRLKKEKGMINYMGSYVFGHCMRQLNCRNTQLSPEHKSQPVIERPLAPTSNTQIEYYYDRFTPAFTVEETAFDILLAKENSHKESQKEFLQRAIEANPKFGFVVEIMKRKFNGEPVRDVAKEYGWNGTNFIYWKRKLVKHLSYCQLAA